MIQLIGGDLFQWDVGRSVVFTPEGTDAEALHFAHQGDSKAVIMELVDSQARIPDYLLQSDKALCVYAVSAGVTFEKVILPVRKRERPENYVYEDDRRNYIYELIQAAEDAVEGANTVVAELRTARDSGEFNGPKGDKGDPGEKGEKGDTGPAGEDGVPATHSWDGTILTITSASGTSSVDLQGEKGDPGEDAPQEAILYIEQSLTDEQKARARENIGAATEGEAGGSNTLIVTITDDVASHTSAEIYAHAQVGSVMLEQNNERWALNHCDAECAVFEQSLPEESVFMAVYVYTDGSTERFEVAVPTNARINSLIDIAFTKKLLTVTYDPDTMIASHTPDVIVAHLAHGGTVQLHDDGFLCEYVGSDGGSTSPSYVRFVHISDDQFIYLYIIYQDGRVEKMDDPYLTTNQINSLIDAKLGVTFDNIDALLGGDS